MQLNIKAVGIHLLTIMFFSACTQAQSKYYAYQVDTYSINTDTMRLSTSRVISCGTYLLEFRMRLKNDIEGNLYMDERKVEITKVTPRQPDTLGVYLLAGGKRYYEFDTFALACRLVQQGSIADREFGFKLGAGKQSANANKSKTHSQPRFTAPKDTVINGIPCYYAEVVRSKLPTDSMGTQYFLIKNKQFTSLYKAQGFKWPDSNYCVVGIHHYAYDGSMHYLQEISNLRPLTAAERKICESLIQKAGLPLPK